MVQPPDFDADAFLRRVYLFLREHMEYHTAEALYNTGLKIHDPVLRQSYYAQLLQTVDQYLQTGKLDLSALRELPNYKWKPVPIQTFIEDPYYLGKSEAVYPKVMEHLIEINSGKYVEVVFTGGIGSGKTTAALYTCAYQVYLLSCLHNPHKLFGLDPSSEILFIFQSINARLAKGVDYTRFRDMISGSDYFKEKFPFDRHLDSKMVFPNRIEVMPVSGSETAAIGQNVIGGLIDELNYMAVVDKSKASVDGGTYDQAVALYNSIARRRKSRFMEQGKLPGILCLVSSKKYPGQFTDQKEEEAKSDPTIYVYDKRVWDIKPEGSFSGEFFYVFAGDLTRKPRILAKGETVPDPDRHLVVAVPVEFRNDFNKDPINALREIAGISTIARHPYFLEVEKVNECFNRHESIFGQERVDFVTSKLTIHPKRFYKPQLPRFVHIDLAVTGDSAGLAIGTVTGFKTLQELGFGSSAEEYMPVFHIDGILEVKPPKGGEILFWKIREVLATLRDKLGLQVRWVTFDSFQSTDSKQLLRQQAFIVGDQSMDTTVKPYDFLKSAMYGGRCALPRHPHCQHEILTLERDTKTGKIDHIPGGSKDCADALAGVVYGLTMRREIWGLYGVPLMAVPDTIQGPDHMEEKDAKLKENIALQV